MKLSVTSMLTLGIPVLSTIGAALFLEEPMVGWQLPGIVIVVVALAAAIHRETQLQLEQGQAAEDFEPEPQA